MTSASKLDPDPIEIAHTVEINRPRANPWGVHALLASAKRITGADTGKRIGYGKAEAWQEDAWEMFDLVGEEHFLATTLSGRLSQARLYVGKIPDDPLDNPVPLDTDESLVARVFSHFGGGSSGRRQIIERLGINLFVAGDGWIVGVPSAIIDPPKRVPGALAEIAPEPEQMRLSDLEWRMMSVTEVQFLASGEVSLRMGEGIEDVIKVDPSRIMLIRVWRPHPRRAWEADSPTKASLPVLRELVGLTMHISAQVDSRLAGAGLLIVPQSAQQSLQQAAGIPETEAGNDFFTEALMEAMMTPISDRASASAVVPLVVTVPDESTGLFQHMTFSAPLDTEARNLRDESIRRLALGQDAPPEVLLGTGGMNHWGAWLVREDVVTTHLEPPLALICDAITSQFLWPVLIDQGMSESEAREYVVWYDVSHMIQRPNRLADTQALHEKGVVGDDTLREAAGYGDNDAPPNINRSVEMAIAMAQANPALVDNLAEIIAAFESVLNPVETNVATLPDAPEAGENVTEEGPPEDTSDEAAPEPADSGEPPSLAATGGIYVVEEPGDE